MKFAVSATSVLIGALALAGGAAAQSALPPAATAAPNAWAECGIQSIETLRRNPSAAEMRCRFGAQGPGQFGLLSYLDVPVYRPATPLPGTHTVGVPGMPHPAPGESYEEWEWRVLRTNYGPSVRNVQNDLMQLDPVFMSMIRRFEAELRRRGISASRRETYRPADRQAWIFQQGRVRPGPFATTTLTSWHSRVDRLGRPAARAADYNVSPGNLPRFHAVAAQIGLQGYGADSNDPGHVYLPDTDAATGAEIAVLRTVPRVMHVTLATGRPEGEWQPPRAVENWRRATREFVTNPVPFYPTLQQPQIPLPQSIPVPRAPRSFPGSAYPIPQSPA
ncbi:MAG TPA: hypothetical protein VE871_00045 [Longimicrobium sp.]|nr:hypothetical protein [Longimicrobium sp.]